MKSKECYETHTDCNGSSCTRPRTLLIGERVRIHPASDWFMRGLTHAVITSKRHVPGRLENLKGHTLYILRPDTRGIETPKRLRIKLLRDYIIAEGE